MNHTGNDNNVNCDIVCNKNECDMHVINICALNVYGLYSKLTTGLFEKFIKGFDVICLSETKITQIETDEILGYTPFNHQGEGFMGYQF